MTFSNQNSVFARQIGIKICPQPCSLVTFGLLIRVNVVPLVEGVKEEKFVPLRPTAHQSSGEDVAANLGDLEGQRKGLQLINALK